MKKHQVFLTLAFVVCFVSIIVFAIGYSQLPEVVGIHKNLRGQTDDWGHKIHLLILPSLSLGLLFVFRYLINRPEILNYPVKITEENRERVFSKMQLSLSLIALIIAAVFLMLIIDGVRFMDIRISLTFLIIYVVFFTLLPLGIIRYVRS